MKQISILICILFLITSCEIQYDGETRIVAKGKIIDENGNPLSEKDIQVTILSGGGLFSASSDLISYGKSDQNGNFTLIFPAPRDDNRISISINDTINQSDEYQSKNIIANKLDFDNYKLDLDNITLYKNESITSLKLLFNETSTNKQIKDIKIEGKQPNSEIDLNPFPNESQYANTYFTVIKNQTIVLKYNIVDYSNSITTTKEQSVSIPIANAAVTYTITY